MTSSAPAIPEPITFTYKKLPRNSIQADVYLPDTLPAASLSPILLFIHGGSWIYGSRHGFSAAYFREFLRKNYVVVSIDYRLLPESKFLDDQLEDIRDVEAWLRDVLPAELSHAKGLDVDAESIVILGVSAGAHLALLTVTTPICLEVKEM